MHRKKIENRGGNIAIVIGLGYDHILKLIIRKISIFRTPEL
jgi:hypothetical protein